MYLCVCVCARSCLVVQIDMSSHDAKLSWLNAIWINEYICFDVLYYPQDGLF